MSRLPAPHNKAIYTSTGIATADTTVHTDAQHDFRLSETMKKN